MRAALAVPDHLGALVVLDEEARRGDVVAVDDHAGVGGVRRPADARAVVGAPGPDVVEDDVVGVHHQARASAAGMRAADAEEDVLDARRLRRRAVAGLVVDPQQRRRAHRARVDHQARDVDAARIGDDQRHRPFSAVSVATPSPRTTVSGRLTRIERPTS